MYSKKNRLKHKEYVKELEEKVHVLQQQVMRLSKHHLSFLSFLFTCLLTSKLEKPLNVLLHIHVLTSNENVRNLISDINLTNLASFIGNTQEHTDVQPLNHMNSDEKNMKIVEQSQQDMNFSSKSKIVKHGEASQIPVQEYPVDFNLSQIKINLFEKVSPISTDRIQKLKYHFKSIRECF